MEEKKRIINVKLFIVRFLLFVISILAVGVSTYICGKNSNEILRNMIIASMGTGLLIFLIVQAGEFHEFGYDNEAYEFRFLICYMIAFVIALICVRLPDFVWPYVSVFLLLSLFSNELIGICASTFLLVCTTLISNTHMGIFLTYFMCGIITVCLFRHLDEQYKIDVPLIVSSIMVFVGVSVEILLFHEKYTDYYLFLMPLINVVVSFCLNLLILRVFSQLVIYKNQDRYLEINDPEFELLAELKKESREEYYKVVHTAYLSDKISKKLHLNSQAVKAAAYYHNIGCLSKDNSCEYIMGVCDSFQFPAQVKKIIYEVCSNKIESKEAGVLYFADAVVNSILSVIGSGKSGGIDYDKIIDAVFEKRKTSKELENCIITVKELNQIQTMFKEEKLYYDFLH